MPGCLPDSSPWSHWHMYSKEWTTRVLWKVFWVGKSLPWIPSVIVPVVERGFWPLNSKFSHEMLRSNWGMSSLGRFSSYIGTNCQKSVFEVFDICKLFSLGLWNCLCAKVTLCSLLNVWIWICRFLIYKVNLLCGYDRVKSICWIIVLAFRLFFRKIISVFWDNDDRIYVCVLYSNINYSNKGQIKRAIYLFSQTKTCRDLQVAQMSVSQQASTTRWILVLPSHVFSHHSAERSIRRLMP